MDAKIPLECEFAFPNSSHFKSREPSGEVFVPQQAWENFLLLSIS